MELLLLLLSTIWMLFIAPPIPDAPTATASPSVLAEYDMQTETAVVESVIDGDTIILEGGQRLRYIGIDTPETKHPRRGIECFGEEATQRNQELVAGKVVELESDVNATDRYGRLLRYVYVDGVMVNQTLVAEGFAQSTPYPPDVRHQELLDAAETAAREADLGLWGAACE